MPLKKGPKFCWHLERSGICTNKNHRSKTAYIRIYLSPNNVVYLFFHSIRPLHQDRHEKKCLNLIFLFTETFLVCQPLEAQWMSFHSLSYKTESKLHSKDFYSQSDYFLCIFRIHEFPEDNIFSKYRPQLYIFPCSFNAKKSHVTSGLRLIDTCRMFVEECHVFSCRSIQSFWGKKEPL